MIKFKINTEYLYTFSGIWLWKGNTLTIAWQGPSGEYRQRQLCLQQPERTDRRPSVSGKTYGYSYDNIGNRKTAREDTEEATAYTTGPLNQYTAIERGEEAAFEPVYDADGNQTLIRTSTGIWQVAYNAENRPIRFESEDGSTVVECTYDYMGRRHTRKVTVNGTVSNYLRYIYRGYLQIAAIDAVSGVFRWFLFWDPTQPTATRPLAIRKDSTWYAYGWDLTKNVTEVFGKAGYLRTAYTYTPYGEATATGDVTQPITWSSEYADEELGLIYYNYRHYNSTDGRWINRDPIAEQDDWNLYELIRNNITYNFDILGLFVSSATTPQGVIILLESGYSAQQLLKLGISSALINEAEKARKKKIKCKDLDNKVKKAKENKYLKRCCVNGDGTPKDTHTVLAKKIIAWDALATARKKQNALCFEFLPKGTSPEEHIIKYKEALKNYQNCLHLLSNSHS